MCLGGGQPAAPVNPAAYPLDKSETAVKATATPVKTDPATPTPNATPPAAKASGVAYRM